LAYLVISSGLRKILKLSYILGKVAKTVPVTEMFPSRNLRASSLHLTLETTIVEQQQHFDKVARLKLF